jgi:hypothetical protein
VGSEFPYLGSLIADNGRVDVEVKKRIASTSKAFGALSLRQAVFKDAHTRRQYTGPVYCLSCCMVVNAGYHSGGPSGGPSRD